MDVMLAITTRDSGRVAVPLMRALTRAGASWGCFFTNDGVAVLRDDACRAALAGAARAVACETSWDLFGAGDCPVERGSQTINSAMIGDARRVVGL